MTDTLTGPSTPGKGAIVVVGISLGTMAGILILLILVSRYAETRSAHRHI